MSDFSFSSFSIRVTHSCRDVLFKVSARVFSSILKFLMSSKLLFSLFLLLPIPIIYDIIKILIFQNYLFVVLLLRLQLVLVFLLF